MPKLHFPAVRVLKAKSIISSNEVTIGGVSVGWVGKSFRNSKCTVVLSIITDSFATFRFTAEYWSCDRDEIKQDIEKWLRKDVFPNGAKGVKIEHWSGFRDGWVAGPPKERGNHYLVFAAEPHKVVIVTDSDDYFDEYVVAHKPIPLPHSPFNRVSFT